MDFVPYPGVLFINTPPPLEDARTLPHFPCPRAPTLPFLHLPSGSAQRQGWSTPSATLNLHWPPTSQGAPTNAWLVDPDSVPPYTPAIEVSLLPTCASGSTWKLGGWGGHPSRKRSAPPWSKPWIILSSTPPPPIYPAPCTTACIATPYLKTGGFFCGCLNAFNHRIAWTGHPAGHSAT